MFRIWFSQIMMLYREAFAMQQSCFMDFFLLLLLSFFFCFFFLFVRLLVGVVVLQWDILGSFWCKMKYFILIMWSITVTQCLLFGS